MGWTTGVRFPAGGVKDIFLPRVQTGSGAHPAYLMGTGDHSLEVKWPGSKTDHSPPFGAEVKNEWSYTYTTPYVFMARCLINQGTTLPLPRL